MCSGRSGAKSYAAPMVVVDARGVVGVEGFGNLKAQCGSRDARATAQPHLSPP